MTVTHSPAARALATRPGALVHLDPREINPDPDNVRREDAAGLESLADSLREHGVLQPLGVARDSGSSRVVYGSRRRAAAIMAGLTEVPCVLVDGAPEDRLVRQLVENLQRQDLNALDQAEGLARLRRDQARQSPAASERQLDEAAARAVGLSVSTVRRYLGLRDLVAPVRDLIAEGELSVTQAQHLSAVTDPARQEEVARLAVERGMSAAAIARACKAAVVRPTMSVADALDLAESDREVPEAAPSKPVGQRVARAPRVEAEDSDKNPWADEEEGEEDDENDGPVAGRVESADGHRVFRIRSVAVFCDEVDRLHHALADGDLDRAAEDDPAAPLKLRLTARQLEHASKLLNQLLGRRGWK
ncbi:MAG: ParB/RepB/Spo0J family partition protein [Chloroflexi bacterium]|nr:ParB/RepB/Spo0J family partition protein [Chloroflexota bacterium]